MPANSSNGASLQERQRKEKQKREMSHYLVSFGMMMALTILAFVAVGSGSISSKFAPLFIIVLAVIQAVFQLYYFMHLKDKGHSFAVGFMASGAVVAILTVATLMTLIWHPH